jgi:hypothetical protein
MHQILGNRILLQRACINNDLVTPTLSSQLCTHEMLLEVYEDKCFLLKLEEVRMK